MTYEELLKRLFQSRRAGVVWGLGRVEACLARLGHPERRVPVRVHVGGTNGKGSTCTFVESVLRASGLRTGLFTSPHLTEFAERFAMDGRPADRAAIIAAAEAMFGAGGDTMTFFEQATVMACVLFAGAGVQAAIYEVGLGGRLDATNAVPCQVAAVTGVALDHQDWLGHTLAAIASEKAGIFKPGQAAVIGRSGEPEAVPLLVAGARAAGVARLRVVDAPLGPDWTLGLEGEHQRDNAATAMAILDHVRDLGLVPITDEHRRQGLLRACIHGRFETLARAPRVIADGAHNPHAAVALSRAMAHIGPYVLVMAVCSDKDAAGILTPLAAGARAVIATPIQSPRGLPVEALQAVCARVAPELPCMAAPGVAQALDMARDLAGPEGTVLAAGSLYLVGEARQALCGDPADAVHLGDPLGRGAG